jgi:predicted choloylglycine hydrolase
MVKYPYPIFLQLNYTSIDKSANLAIIEIGICGHPTVSANVL